MQIECVQYSATRFTCNKYLVSVGSIASMFKYDETWNSRLVHMLQLNTLSLRNTESHVYMYNESLRKLSLLLEFVIYALLASESAVNESEFMYYTCSP